MLHLWCASSLVRCIFDVIHLCCYASLAGGIFGKQHIWCNASMVCWIFGALHHCCAAALVRCHFCDLYIYCNISLMHCIFGALHHWCYVFAPLVCYALASLVCIIVGALQLWWIISWLQYFFGVMYLRCVASLVLCICTFGMLCIGIFGGASLVRLLLCNASLVHCFLVLGAIYFWCCVFGAMHCQLYRAGLLPQRRM